MIRTVSELPAYRTRFSDSEHQGVSDTTPDKGGNHAGFRPHDLIEAALATCMSMTVRMYADQHGIPLRSLVTRVRLDRTDPEEGVFYPEIELHGDLTSEQVQKLIAVANHCPVRRTLSKKIRLECTILSG